MSVDLLIHYEEDTIMFTSRAFWGEIQACFDFDRLFYVDIENKLNKGKNIFSNINEVIKNNPDYEYVFMLPGNNVPRDLKREFLIDFIHPKDNVIYVIGSNSFGLPIMPKIIKKSKIVSILLPCGSSRPMWDSEVAICVGYDRWIKGFKK
jgi:hypothetical protein